MATAALSLSDPSSISAPEAESEDVGIPAGLQESLDGIEANCRWPLEYLIAYLLGETPKSERWKKSLIGGPPTFNPVTKKWKLKDGYKEPPLPAEDCFATPGPAKVPTMAKRYEEGKAIQVPLIVFLDEQGRVKGARGDSVVIHGKVYQNVVTALEDRHWNGSPIRKGYSTVDFTKGQTKLQELRAIAEIALKRKRNRKALLIERHRLMKARKETMRQRPQEAMATQACPTCGASIGVRCKGGRIHKARRKVEIVEVERK